MGVFNKAIPKYTGNIYNEIVVQPVEEQPVFVDDVFDPILNKAVRENLMNRYGNPISATFGGYAELVNNAFLGNKRQGGTMLPGVGILSSFGRSMDKAGDVILGTLTEGVKGVTGQGVESPLYNIFTEDEDYSGQRLLAASANSMAKMAGAPELTEADFGGVWTIPSLGIDLATDPSILGGNLTKVANGTGAVADMGRLFIDYDDLMAKVAIDATAPGLRPLAKKVGSHVSSLLSNHRSEQGYTDAYLYMDNILSKAKIDYDSGDIDFDTFKTITDNVRKRVDSLEKAITKDVTNTNLSKMKEQANVLQDVIEDDDYTKIVKKIDEYNAHANMVERGKRVSDTTDESISKRQRAVSEISSFLNKNITSTDDVTDYVKIYKDDPEQMFKDLGIKQNVDLFPKNNFGHEGENFNPEYYDRILVGVLPQNFVTKYNITKREDLLNLIKSDNLTTEAYSDLNNLFKTNMYGLKQSTRGGVKIAPSMSKLPTELQLFVNNEQQQIISNIISKAVDLKIIDAKDISERTLDDIFDTIYSHILRYPTSEFNKDFNLFSAFNHYRFTQGYFKDKLNSYMSPIWNKPQFELKPVKIKGKVINTPIENVDRANIRHGFKTLDKRVSSTFHDIGKALDDFKTATQGLNYESPEYLKAVTEFLDKNSIPYTNMTYRQFAEDILEDELHGKVAYTKYKPRFEHLTSREQVQAYKAREEFNEFYKLVRKYNEDGASLKPHLPTKVSSKRTMEQFYNPTEVSIKQRQAAKFLKKQVKHTSKIDELMQYIQKEISSFEQNIGSKLGGRVFTGTSEDLLNIGKTTSDTTIGLTKAINDALYKIDFKTPVDVYSFMHKTFKTADGEFSLADLGFEVTSLPSKMLNDLKAHTKEAFTKPVNINGKNISLYDVIARNPYKIADGIISEKDYNKFFADSVEMSYNEFVSRLSKIKPTHPEAFKDPDIKDEILNEISNPELYLKNWFNDFKVVKTNKEYQFLNRLRPDLGKMSRSEYIAFNKDLRSGRETLFNQFKPYSLDLTDTATRDIFEYLKSQEGYLNPRDLEAVSDAIKRNYTDFNEYQEALNALKVKKQSVEEYTFSKINDADIKYIKKLNTSDTDKITTDLASNLTDTDLSEAVAGKLKLYEEADIAEKVNILNKLFPDETPLTVADLDLYIKSDGGKDPIIRYIDENHPKQMRLYDIIAKEFRLNLSAKQDRDAILSATAVKELLDEATSLEEFYKASKVSTSRVYDLIDKQRTFVVKGDDFLSDLALAGGRKIISYHPVRDKALIDATRQTIQQNIDVINKAVGSTVLEPIDKLSVGHLIGYRMVGTQKDWKKVSKLLPTLKFNDVVFEPAVKLTAKELDYLNTTGKPILDLLKKSQALSKEYYNKLGFVIDDADDYFKHVFKNTEGWQEAVGIKYYDGIDVNTSEQLSEMVLNLGYLGDFRGTYGVTPNTRIFEGSASRYDGMFSTNLETIVKGTYTKGIFANEKFQTTISLFDNSEFKLNTYCKNIDDVKNILNSESNVRNLTIASPVYKDGVLTGFTKYDNFSDASLTKALNDGEAIFVPTHIFATLDKACKQKAKMSNKIYAFVNRYLTAPFKIGILLNPGFLLGNMSDAYLKQASTMAKKYGTSVSEELAQVASSIRTTMYLNNKFSDIYDIYLKDLADSGVDIKPLQKMSKQVANSKSVRDSFIKYLDGTYEAHPGRGDFITPSITDDDAGIAKVWIHLNAVQPTEGVTKELLGDSVTLNYAKNPVDRVLYGLRNYKGTDVSTWGLLNNPPTKALFGSSEYIESVARSASILNDLKHQGIDLNEFARILGEDYGTEFNVKMLDAINAMHNANFDYNATSPVLDALDGFVPFPTFWLKNISYWFDMFMNHPQYIDHALSVNEGLWANENVEDDEFKADAKGRGAIPLSAVSESKPGQKLSNFFKGIYKPSPLQSMFTAFNALNHPVESLTQRVHPLIQGAGVATEKALNTSNLTTNLFNPEDVRYRPYNTDQYQPNINLNEEEFNPLAYTGHKMNPFDRVLNTGLRTPGKVKRGEAQLSDFLPSVFQPDFSKK